MQRARSKTFLVIIITNALIGLGDLVVAAVFLARHEVLWLLAKGMTLPGKFGEIVRLSEHALRTLSPYSHRLAIWYFVSHGLVKLFLSWALLRDKLWAYPLALIFFGCFSVYQLATLPAHHSLFDFILITVNLLVFIFVAKEYRTVLRLKGEKL